METNRIGDLLDYIRRLASDLIDSEETMKTRASIYVRDLNLPFHEALDVYEKHTKEAADKIRESIRVLESARSLMEGTFLAMTPVIAEPVKSAVLPFGPPVHWAAPKVEKGELRVKARRFIRGNTIFLTPFGYNFDYKGKGHLYDCYTPENMIEMVLITLYELQMSGVRATYSQVLNYIDNRFGHSFSEKDKAEGGKGKQWECHVAYCAQTLSKESRGYLVRSTKNWRLLEKGVKVAESLRKWEEAMRAWLQENVDLHNTMVSNPYRSWEYTWFEAERKKEERNNVIPDKREANSSTGEEAMGDSVSG